MFASSAWIDRQRFQTGGIVAGQEPVTFFEAESLAEHVSGNAEGFCDRKAFLIPRLSGSMR
ncbi:MAG: hypothetical protein AAGA83_27170 [Cyanobacteria bacterium P01_F01_bin.116]